MKRITLALLTLFSVTALSSFIDIDSKKKEKSLETLWEEYVDASWLDRVQKMADVLEQIKVKAIEERANWDYYRACYEYVNVRSSRDWKLRDSLEKQMRNELLAYDEPLLLYLMDNRAGLAPEALLESVEKMKDRLREGHNVKVYNNNGYIFNRAVPALVDNDYEYVLWDLFRDCYVRSWNPEFCENVYALLQDESGDSYPKAGLAEYLYVTRVSPAQERKGLLESIAQKYEGQALALFPLYYLLEMEFNNMADKGGSEYYLDLKKRVESYEYERKSYRSGVDELLLQDFTKFEQLLKILESKSGIPIVRNGEAQLALRNLDKVMVVMTRGKETVYEALVKNPARSFYVNDTLDLDLPPIDDGEYIIRCFDGKKEVGELYYPKFTLSVAMRKDDKGAAVYVADYLSGQPLERVDITLYKGDRKVVEVGDVPLTGFTYLPEEIGSRLDGKSSGYYLMCSCVGDDGKIRRSQQMYLSSRDAFATGESVKTTAAVMLDRAAFNPGETVKFKAIVYESSSDGTRQVVSEGMKVSVVLRDASGNVIAEKELQTNGFGSVAGEFVLEGIKRNGRHSVWVKSGDRNIGSADLTVDEFVLPTFDVVFEKAEKLFLPGDTIDVKGKVTSYSGHPVSSATMVAKVSLDGRLVREETVKIKEDGSFEIDFIDEAFGDVYSPYEIEVIITDLTGETLSFFHRQYIMRRPVVSIDLENNSAGSFRLAKDGQSSGKILSDDVAHISFGVSCQGRTEPLSSIPVKYYLMKGDSIVSEADIMSDEGADIDFSDLPSGRYELLAEVVLTDARGEKIEGRKKFTIVKVRDEDSEIDGDFENIFRVMDEDEPVFQIGAGCGPIWAVAELFGDRGQRLNAEILDLDKGEMRVLRYAYKDDYPDALLLNVLYFRDSQCYTFTHTWRRRINDNVLPLEFVRFEDMSAPGSVCSVVMKSGAGSEVLASVFDASTENIRKNRWADISAGQASVASVPVNALAGMDGYRYHSDIDLLEGGVRGVATLSNSVVVGYGSRRMARSSAKANVTESADYAGMEEDSFAKMVPEEAVNQIIRDDFSTSLTFEPFLYPSADGTVKLDFTTSDKLSTFTVSVFAHDKSMNNNVIRRDMLVTLPVKVSVVQPQYLYEGDHYVLRASVSNTSDSDISGMVILDGSVEGTCEVSVPVGGSVPVSFDVPVPSDTDKIEFKVIFVSGNYTEGVLVSIPVYPDSQVLTEAHSAVLLDGMSEEELLHSLRERFVNVSSIGAEYSEISVIDMMREALPLTVQAEGKDVISQSEALYVNLLAAGLRSSEGLPMRDYVDAAMNAASEILKCLNADGGFGWFEGMKSSPIVTAVVLERFAGLRDRKLLDIVSEELGEDALDAFDDAVVSAVGYLDSVYFNDPDRPLWYGCVSLWQYLNVRSMYVGVPFDAAAARKAAGAKEYNEFKHTLRACLIPRKEERWTDGNVLDKVRMIKVITALESSGPGLDLAKAWGISSGRKLRKSMEMELQSLKEYAVEHPSGGVYYPNAVLPWRGLLESEAYAHSLICDLFRELSAESETGTGLSELADGISLWLMLQKETQQWSSDPGFVEAMASVYDASASVRQTKVMTLTQRYEKPFEDVKASGNGFKVSVAYYKELPGENGSIGRVELREGENLSVGDKIIAVYSLWSEENRSFVRLSVPRPACLRPQDQLSGWNGGWLRSLSYGFYSISPYAYREVKADRTLYWIDVFPEEKSSVEEVLFVTQDGCFTSPVAEIESLYAPHYRANASYCHFR